MIELLGNDVDNAYVAKLLLMQAGITPDGYDSAYLDTQYEIETFKIDVKGIVIVGGKEHKLKVVDSYDKWHPEPHTVGRDDEWLTLACRILEDLGRDDVSEKLQEEFDK